MEATYPSQRVGTARASSGTTVHDSAHPFAASVSRLGMAVPRFQAVKCYVFDLKAHEFLCETL